MLLGIDLHPLNAPPSAGKWVHSVYNIPALRPFSRSRRRYIFGRHLSFGRVRRRSTYFSALHRRQSQSRSCICCLVVICYRSSPYVAQNRIVVVVVDFVVAVLTAVVVAVLKAVAQWGDILQAVRVAVEVFLQAPVLVKELLLQALILMELRVQVQVQVLAPMEVVVNCIVDAAEDHALDRTEIAAASPVSKEAPRLLEVLSVVLSAVAVPHAFLWNLVLRGAFLWIEAKMVYGCSHNQTQDRGSALRIGRRLRIRAPVNRKFQLQVLSMMSFLRQALHSRP